MDELDFDERLRESGANVREIAPDRNETAAALTAVVTRRAERRWIAPAALVGVAATVIGLLVWLAYPSEDGSPPAESPDRTPTSELLDARWSIDRENWDGRGGRCLTVTDGGEAATGCVEGTRLGVELWAAIGSEPIVLEPTASGYLVGRHTFSGDMACNAGVLQPGRLHEFACGLGLQQVRLLPDAPVRDFSPVASSDLPFEFDPIRVDGVRGVTAYLSRALPGATEQCLVLLVEHRSGWREACRDFSRGGRLAVGVDRALWIVDVAPNEDRVSIASAATSASIYGCQDTMLSILGQLDRTSLADGLACAGGGGLLTTPRQDVTQRLLPGPRTSQICFGTADCGERGTLAAPLPIAPGIAYRPASDDVLRIDDLTDEASSIEIPPEADARSIGFAVLDRFHDRGEVGSLPGMPGPFDPSVEVVDPTGLVIVNVPALDDAAGDETFAVWLDGLDVIGAEFQEFSIERLYRINTCARGIVVEDGQRLCV